MKRRRFDSDDDEDEYAPNVACVEMSAPLDRLTEDVLLDMGIDESAHHSAEEDDEAHNVEMKHTESSQDAATSHPDAASPTSEKGAKPVKKVPLVMEDRDVPREWRQLLSDQLLDIYSTPLSYMFGGLPTDDALLAQYLPYDEARVPTLRSLNDEDSHTFSRNGIAPGWRWDGVVRGRV